MTSTFNGYRSVATAQRRPCAGFSCESQADLTATAVTIVETRPPFDHPTGVWTRFSIARSRNTTSNGMSSLYWRDRHLRFHRYDRVPPTRHVQELLDFVADSGDPIFRGDDSGFHDVSRAGDGVDEVTTHFIAEHLAD